MGRFGDPEEPVSPEQTDVEDKVAKVLSGTHGELWRKWGAMSLYHRKDQAWLKTAQNVFSAPRKPPLLIFLDGCSFCQTGVLFLGF